MMGRAHFLPGSTFSNPKQREKYKSEVKARLTSDELQQWFAQEVLDYYERRHSMLGISPREAWERTRRLRSDVEAGLRGTFLEMRSRPILADARQNSIRSAFNQITNLIGSSRPSRRQRGAQRSRPFAALQDAACLASRMSIRARRPCLSIRCRRLAPFSKVRGLPLAN